MPRLHLCFGLLVCAGCASQQHLTLPAAPTGTMVHEQVAAASSPADVATPALMASTKIVTLESARIGSEHPQVQARVASYRHPVREGIDPAVESLQSQPITHVSLASTVRPADAISVVPPLTSELPPVASTAYSPSDQVVVEERASQVGIGHSAIQMNLPTALAMVGGQHPAVGFAQWRVQEAYAQLSQARVLWLPSLQAGFSFHRHDGNYQASDGRIVDIDRNSFQYGLGSGAVGAGTTPRPGLVAQFHLADAIFQPEIAQKMAWARGHASTAVTNTQLRNAAISYLQLLDAHQTERILDESRLRTAELAKLTGDFAAAGQGLQADADRVQTELLMVENRLLSARERIEVTSARLAQVLSLDGGPTIIPQDPTLLPLELVNLGAEKSQLIATGLANRPELKESQALVAAACEQYRRQQYAPFVPSVLLGFSSTGFGGGLANSLNNVDDRMDFDALMSWQVRNFGLGERAARREANAQVEQAKYEKIRAMDQVASEIATAYAEVLYRGQQIGLMQQAIGFAENSFERNLSRIRDGQGLPLEVLQSVRALEDARLAYLKALVDHNQSQFQLQWALGWPITAES
ncbi:TolC family protein [Aureliella helgolandensis]|uniref:Outer membrane efflux protein n=1 Tax=Aureliella helgolandensis TaxID=2527968 RepID=A0A518G1F7_9BACT|nr:TolC family protein [Aureliella helgolandensis]QDV22431.1 Outer membrane efflux protein [Aureliella helgolandensis]